MIHISTAIRDARLDAIETAIGTSAVLELRSGPAPASCSAPTTGTLLVSMALPVDWMDDASAGVKTKKGTWAGLGVANGIAGYYRIYSSGGTCHLQGSVTITSGGGDLVLNNPNIATGQNVTVAAYSWTEGNS